ncbi:SDR family NAD(P)-dependent oxidoreductase [Thalassobaculum sp.]|uniref:SDR family NAD(P)-dependent oxidoreductase n=1 Tax=Thalassobaculum sp. TaxID=2022740 RepID=UPI0032EC8D84
MGKRLKGKVALVTGAGSIGPGWGNGKASATLYAREGARVFLVDNRADAVEETRRIIEGEGGSCATHVCDVTRSDQVAAMVAACVAAFGTLDILHNNVGYAVPGGPVTLSEQDWDDQMSINLRHVFLATKYAIPVMETAGGGAIVNIGSTSGVTFTGQQQIGYQVAKAAIVRFSRSVALEYAPKGIRCNTVVPGQMHTPLVEAHLAGQQSGGDAEALIARRNARIPMGFMGTGWDVAHACLFLVSDEARYVTGAEIVVDGGLTLKCTDR